MGAMEALSVFSPPLMPALFFATKLSEVFKKKRICVSSDPGLDHYLCVSVSVGDATVVARTLQGE